MEQKTIVMSVLNATVLFLVPPIRALGEPRFPGGRWHGVLQQHPVTARHTHSGSRGGNSHGWLIEPALIRAVNSRQPSWPWGYPQKTGLQVSTLWPRACVLESLQGLCKNRACQSGSSHKPGTTLLSRGAPLIQHFILDTGTFSKARRKQR